MNIKSLFTIGLLLFFTKNSYAEDLAALQLGIKTKELSASKKDSSDFDFQITSNTICSFGDLDAMFMDLYNSPDETSLYLRLEDLTSKEKIFSKNLIAEKFDEKVVSISGFVSKMVIPASKDFKIFGMYVCKDINSNGSCAEKKAIDINQVVNVYNAEKPENVSEIEDKNYFFSFLIMKGDKLSILESPLSVNEYPVLKKYFIDNGIAPEIAEKAVGKIRSLNDTLGSESLSFIEQKGSPLINITLPRLDSKKCYREKGK